MKFPHIDDIIRFEDGQMTEEEIIEFFQEGLDEGWVWHMQGYYGRMATRLLEAGLIAETVAN